MKRAFLLVAGLGATAALTACGGDIQGIVVQGNMNPLYMTTAVVAVAEEAGYEITVPPVCEMNSNKTSYSCTGKTANGQQLSAAVPYATQSSENATLIVTVGKKTIYDGPITEALLKNAQVGS